MKLSTFLGGIGNFWQQFVALVLQIKTTYAFGANAQELKDGTLQKWSISDTQIGARTVEEIKERAKKHKFNSKFPLLFDFIPMDHVVIDTLHLFLRVSDVLIELLILELRTQDAINKNQTFANGFAGDKFNHMAKYETFLKSIGIKFEWFVNKDTKKLQYRDLTGPEKLLLFQKIDISDLLPQYEKSGQVQVLWNDFINLIGDLKLSYDSSDSISQFDARIKQWIKDFNRLYLTSDVTP